MEKKLEDIKKEVLNCQQCNLYKERVKNEFYSVIGEGNHKAQIMFIGEAPGLNEAKTGHPFCGAAGKILNELLEAARIKREDVYITNILKDRPPENRNPQKEEILACAPYLDRQIAVIKPKIICTLGNFSTVYIMEKYGLKEKIEGISKIHGKIFESKSLFETVKIIPLYHPAVVAYNLNMKGILNRDFVVLKEILANL